MRRRRRIYGLLHAQMLSPLFSQQHDKQHANTTNNTPQQQKQDLPEDAPVVILLPGLTGGSTDTYVQHAVQQARGVGVRAAVFNSRGTASSPVLTPQFYSASFTDDMREVRCCLPGSVLVGRLLWGIVCARAVETALAACGCTPPNTAQYRPPPLHSTQLRSHALQRNPPHQPKQVVNHVRARFPKASALYAAGWSLGANILVNYLGEEGPNTPVQAAVSMCNPFDLEISNAHLQRGLNRVYDWNLAASLRRIFASHAELWRSARPPLRPDLVPAAKTIRQFDEAITIHSFGWPSVDDYYAGSSSAKRLGAVAVPLLCIQAADDPIAPAEAIPYAEARANPNVMLTVTPAGGHLGWAAGPGAPFGHPWTDGAVTEWLAAVTELLPARKQQQQQARAPAAAAAAADVRQAANGEAAAAAAAVTSPVAVAAGSGQSARS